MNQKLLLKQTASLLSLLTPLFTLFDRHASALGAVDSLSSAMMCGEAKNNLSEFSQVLVVSGATDLLICNRRVLREVELEIFMLQWAGQCLA